MCGIVIVIGAVAVVDMIGQLLILDGGPSYNPYSSL
jgi:hypothetical protein